MIEIFRCPECNKPYKTKKCYNDHYNLCLKGEIEYKQYHNLTDEYQDLAWTLLTMGFENSDQSIANRLGVNKRDVSVYLADRSKQLLEKINNR